MQYPKLQFGKLLHQPSRGQFILVKPSHRRFIFLFPLFLSFYQLGMCCGSISSDAFVLGKIDVVLPELLGFHELSSILDLDVLYSFASLAQSQRAIIISENYLGSRKAEQREPRQEPFQYRSWLSLTSFQRTSLG